MRLLLLTHAFNSLSQRIWLELNALGHEVSIEFDINDAATRRAVELWQPDIVIAPFLKRAIPEDVWRAVPCLIVHPGPPGDKGPHALDWAILEKRKEWGVTVIEAVAEMDAGPVWAFQRFAMREAAKSSLYRREVTEAAVVAVKEALRRRVQALGPISQANDALEGAKPPIRLAERAIDWQRDDAADIIRKIRAADGQPGVPETFSGHALRLHDAWPAQGQGKPGTIIGRAGDATLWAARDGAVWIGHITVSDVETGRRLKLPAVTALERLGLPMPPEVAPDGAPNRVTVETSRGVRIIRFPFLNGAMSPARSRALEAAIREAADGPEKVVLMFGGQDFWSNGLDLASIEAAESPAEASLESIEAIDDVCRALIETTGKLVIAGVTGDAAAGGVFMALAADEIAVREGVVLNPHYKNMGNLFGSEYWTYLLPRRLAEDKAKQLMDQRLPLSATKAVRLGLFDHLVAGTPDAFERALKDHAVRLAALPDTQDRIAAKITKRAADEANKPLAAYRAEELAQMRQNFFGFDTSYHVARFDLIAKTPNSRTPLHLARHRRGNAHA